MQGIAYIRTNNESSRVGRRFGPKTADHPSIGELCPACRLPFVEGEYTTLIALGPGNDPEAREKAFLGRYYNAVAIEVHWACAIGDFK